MTLLLFVLLLMPQRIVSTSPSITEIVFALGAGDRLVGVTTYCKYPAAALEKPKIGGFNQPNVEVILKRNPDLVILMKGRDTAAAPFKRAGINVIEVRHENLNGIFQSIDLIAATLGVPQRGVALNASIRADIHAATSAPLRRPPSVTFIVGRTPGTLSDFVVAGEGSYLHELIELAGGLNTFGTEKLAYPRVAIESLIHRNPDIIIDMGHDKMASQAAKEEVLRIWRKLPLLRAVQHGNVFPLSADYFITPGPRVGQAVRELRRIFEKGVER